MPRLVFAVNFKAYETAFNEKSLEIAREASKASSRYSNVRVILIVPAAVVSKVLQIYDDIYIEHADPVDYGAYTGYLPAKAAKLLGVRGILVNHSEHKMIYRDVAKVVETASRDGIETMACADTPGEAAGLAYLRPTYIAIEPPELIGTGVSVSKARPEVITEGVKAVKAVADIPVLAGAGITYREDVIRAVQLGASGILLASAVMKAADPGKALSEFVDALSSAA
ncbi:triose-phosphate isomerase [Acidilobus sp.]|uniref:triose-phosphate isomerase n=1 Tax=Acidilobus sp. TaxID=1872109 RepID=UPI003CFCC764